MTLLFSHFSKLHLPKISNSLMQWSNALCNKEKQITFSLADTNSVFTAQIYTARELTLDHYDIGLLIEIDTVPASLWMTSLPLSQHIAKYLAGKKLDSLPVDLRAELLEIAWRPLLSTIMFHTNAQVRVLNFLKLKPSSVNEFSLGITLRDHGNDQESNLIMLMHDRLLPVMQRLFSFWPNHTNSSFWYHQKTPLWLQAGTLELSLDELNALEPADILVLESMENEQQLRLRLGLNHYYTASVEANQLTIESGIQTMSEENLNVGDDAINAIGDVPVRLTFDLGELVLPFSDIQSLTQGYVIDLNIPVKQAVTIRSLNKIIGAGELVDIDGRMGVRIVKLLGTKTGNDTTTENIDG